MKKIIPILIIACFMLTITACGDQAGTSAQQKDHESESSRTEAGGQSDTSKQSENDPEGSSDKEKDASDSNILVAYFSLAGEQYEVGVIEKGNTEIVAEMIAEATGADTFKIESTEEYPTTYDGLLDISRKEEDDPPEISGTVDNMDDYDTIFLGYPIWWGDTPTIIKVFLQSYDLSGKTIIPFCTHGGSGLSGTDETISEICPDSTIGEGFAIAGSTAQNDRDSTKNSVTEWLSDSGY